MTRRELHPLSWQPLNWGGELNKIEMNWNKLNARMGSLYRMETSFGKQSLHLGKFTRFLIRIQEAEKSIPTFEKVPRHSQWSMG